MKEEFSKNKKPQINVSTVETKQNIPNMNPNPFGNMPNMNDMGNMGEMTDELKKFQDLLGNMMKGLDTGEFGLNENMGSEKDIFDKFSKEINDLEKKLKEVEKIEKPTSKSTQKPQETHSSNPFADSFKEICGNDNELKGMMNGLGDLNGLDFKNMFAGMNGTGSEKDYNKNMSDLMGILDTINEKDNKTGGGEDGGMNKIFETLFEVLLKEDVLTVPLSTIKTKLGEYLLKNGDKVSEEEKKKYEQITLYIDELLNEIKKPQPNKEHIINVFEKLHTIGELPSEIMQGSEENMNMLNFAQNMFKK